MWLEFHTQTLKPSTRESYRSLLAHLTRFLGRPPQWADIASPTLCQRFAQWLHQRVCPSSACTYLNKLYALLRKAHRAGLVEFNPSDHPYLRQPRPLSSDPRFLTAPQVLALEQAPCPHLSTKRAFLFAVHTGLRLSDIESLQREHLQQRGRQHFVVKIQSKTGHPVRIPLNDKALEILKTLGMEGRKNLGVESGKTGLVFNLMSRTTIANDLRAWAQAAGLELRLTFHVSRHTFATILLQSHIDIYTVSRLCGHTRVSTTERYTHLTDTLYADTLNTLNHYWSQQDTPSVT